MITKFYEKGSRSLLKSITFRIVIVIADGVIVYALTHRLDLALGIVVIRNIFATILYWGHERIWNNIAWGKGEKKTTK
jgi:uncharacterized membrane protein